MKKNIDIFDDYFEPQIRERGMGYVYNELVQNIKNNNHLYTATINGTRRYNVRLKLNDKEDKIVEAGCNCPYSIDREKYCKHIYALLYSIKGEKLDNKPIRNTTPRYTPPTTEVMNIKCPNCGSNLRIDSPSENIECKYCHSTFALDIRLAGLAKKKNEIIEQAELYFNAEDFGEAYYEFAKAYALDKEDKFIKYCMDVSNRHKNLSTNLSLNDYSRLYEEMKEVFNDDKTEEEQKKKMCVSFINLLTRHANKHLNRIDITGEFFWLELDGILDYYYKMLKELKLTDELKVKVYKNYIDALETEIKQYDTFSEYASNPKLALQKAFYKLKKEKMEIERKM